MQHRWQEFVRAEEVKSFWNRAEAGEFAKKPGVPIRPPSKTKKA